MKKAFTALSFVIIVFLSACGPKINAEQQERLKTLTLSTDSIAEMVNAIDSNQIAKSVEVFFTHKEFLQNKMRDTLSRDLIFKLDKYLSLRKSMSYLRSDYINIASEANIMQQQLADLNKDISNRLIDEKKFETYYELELKNYEQLKFATDRLKKVQENSLPVFEKSYPFIDSLINAYQLRVNE